MIYFIQAGDGGPIKVGFTHGPISSRMSSLQAACPDVLSLLATTDGDRKTEAELHVRFAQDHIRGEWFAPSILPHIYEFAPVSEENERISASVRSRVKDAITKLRRKEDVSESEMVATLIEEALAAREAKGKAA